ncbi:flagellar biosynthesis protein FlgG [Helicobacter pylori]
MGILAGPIGWVITGALVSINLAGPAYRVTVPAYVLIATLRRKPKQINKAKTDNEKGGKGIFIFLVILVIFSPIIFSQKENTNQATTQAIAQKAVLKTLKTLATKIKEW